MYLINAAFFIRPQQLVGLCATVLLLSGCQLNPTVTPAPARPISIEPETAVIAPPVTEPIKTVIAAPEFGHAPLSSQQLPSSTPSDTPNPPNNTRPLIVPLPQPAPSNGIRRDGHNIPAFNGLLNIAREQMAQNKRADAEQTLTRAQRMAPDSPTVYAYFAEIAIKNQQWNRADAMARRGLLLTQNPQQQRTFWQIVLLSAQQQNNPRGVQEAQQKIAQLR